MRVLLLAMPDTVSALDPILKIPNLGLCSIAGSLGECEVHVADLAFRNRRLGERVAGLLARLQPELVGLSAMSFQYDSARRVARLCRRLAPGARVALGGYHASMMYEEIAAGPDAPLFDFLVRGEGERTFQRLARELSSGGQRFAAIPGLSYRSSGGFRHNRPAPLLRLEQLPLPNRDCRLYGESRFLTSSLDCVETSRGCTRGCRFCSITRMYGRQVRRFPLQRVVEDLRRLKARGTRGVFFVDDNITLDVPRLKELCRLIIAEGLHTMAYLMQASVAGIASDPELAPLMARAGFRWVFLGIESGLARNLRAMGKGGVLRNTRTAVKRLQEQGICIFGGFIVGNPEDRRRDIRATFRYALELGVDHPIVQCLTPYPKTDTREELLARGLVTNPGDFSRYNGMICNVRTEHLSERALTRAILWSGIGYFFHPRYVRRSRFWRYSPSLWPALVANNFRFVAGAARRRLFASRHRW
jgi:anaerobic magnesium-protoporphyrin IX monomethyl ester cyclase